MMANEHEGEEVIKLGGREYVMKFTWRALRMLEKMRGGESVIYTMQNAEERVGADFLIAAIYCGLLWDKRHAKLTIEKVEELFDGAEYGNYIKAVVACLQSCMRLPSASADPDAPQSEPADPLE